jgi:hypothetical protein
MYTQLLKCSYTLYGVPYPTENYKQCLPNGIWWLFIDLLPFWPYDASFPALYDVAASWLRLKTLIDCIPHPYWMYIKSNSTLRCCGWAYRCIIIAVIRVQVGVNFRGNVVWLSPLSLYDVAVSWLRLQTPIDCIPHPYWMYTKCFSSLRWCNLCRITCAAVLHVQVGVSFRENGVWPSLYDVLVSLLRLQTPIDCIPHP